MSQSQLSRLSDLRIDPKHRHASRVWGRVLGVLGMLALAAGLVLLGLFGLGLGPKNPGDLLPGWASAMTAATVTTTRVILRKEGGAVPGSGVLTASGYVVARQRAAVSARTSGLLEARSVDIGDPVKKGQIIARIEHSREDVLVQSAKTRLAVAEANLAEQKAEWQIAQKDIERQKRLRQQGIATEQTYDDAEARLNRSVAKVQSLEAEISAAKSSVSAAEVDLEYTNIRAPFDATVLTKDAEIGEIVAPVSVGGLNARGSIVTIADLKDLEVEVDVSEAYISRIRPALPAQVIVDAYPDHVYRGQVRQIVPAANRQKAAVMVKVKILDADEKVLPEMGAKVTFLEEALPELKGQEPKSTLFVDARAIRKNDGGSYVLAITNGRATARSIETGQQKGSEIEVLRGIGEGEVVILEGPPGLADGAAIRVEE